MILLCKGSPSEKSPDWPPVFIISLLGTPFYLKFVEPMPGVYHAPSVDLYMSLKLDKRKILFMSDLRA